MLMRFDPFRDFDRLASQLLADGRVPRSMPMDAYRRGDEFVVNLDLPGMDPDSIDLTVERDVLTVTAEREAAYGDDDQVMVAERAHGTHTRRIFLGESLDTDRLEANYDRGVLRIRIPVLESARPRRVPVAIGSNGAQAITSGSAA